MAIKIARQAYRRIRQAELATFAENVFNRTDGVTAYATIQPSITALTAPLTRYKEALAAARNRGISEMLAKNLARMELLRQLDILADAVETLAADNLQVIVDAGFTVRQKAGQRYTGELPPPVILRAFSTGKRGELRIVVDDIIPKAVRTHIIEYSLNRDNGWQNGEYHSHRRFILKGLPSSSELWIHLKSVGHGDNKSQWSEPVAVAVL